MLAFYLAAAAQVLEVALFGVAWLVRPSALGYVAVLFMVFVAQPILLLLVPAAWILTVFNRIQFSRRAKMVVAFATLAAIANLIWVLRVGSPRWSS